MNIKEVRKILSEVQFARSCVDMGWEWEAKEIYTCVGCADYERDGFAIRTTFQRPDRLTGKLTRGFGRWWLMPEDVTETGIVKTAFAAAKLILEHELMESFHYREVRVFDPHHDVEDLRAAAKNKVARS